MNNYTNILSWMLRIIVSGLFVISALGKLYPSPYFAISTFEVQQLYPLGIPEAIAPFLSRALIGFEFALGILLLLNFQIKRVVIPATIFVLLVFTIHLSYVSFQTGGTTGNCGCFGDLIPMTPIESIIKNSVAMVLLVILYTITTKRNNDKWLPIIGISLLSIGILFFIAPIKKITTDFVVVPETSTIEMDTISKPSVQETENISSEIKLDTVEKKSKLPKNTPDIMVEDKTQPAKVKSGYAKFFSKIDSGKKTLCFFVPGCDHCRVAAKQLTELKQKNPNSPAVFVLFMNEEIDLIPDFFKEAGATYPYKIIEVIPFWTFLGSGNQTPGVRYLWNGNTIKYYEGITTNQFNPTDYEVIIEKPFSPSK